MDARHEIYVDKFSCICSDEGKARAEERLATAIALIETMSEGNARIFEARAVNDQTQYATLLLDFILYWNQGWIRSIAADQWGGLNVEYNLGYIEYDENEDEDTPDFEYKLTGRIQFDRTIDGLVEAFLLYEERQQHIDAYLAKEKDV